MFRNTRAEAAAGRGERAGFRGRGCAAAVIGLALLILAGGCAPALYSVNLRYEPTKAAPAAPVDGQKYTMTVAAFVDQRKIADTLLIGRVVKPDGESIPVMPQHLRPADAVTAALRELLFKSGYLVSPDRPAWDLADAAIRPEWGTILIGGAIDELDVTCLDNLTLKRYSARARLTLHFADVQKKRTFHRVTSQSTSSLDHVFFSEEKLEAQINAVLSDAIEKAFEGPETIRRIREVLRQ